jgi:hypothetical protein
MQKQSNTTLPISRKLTRERFEKLNQPGQPSGSTPFGRQVRELFLTPLSGIIASRLKHGWSLPRGNLGALLRQLDPDTLAFLALAPVLRAVDVPRDEDEEKSKARGVAFTEQIGRGFYARVELDRGLKHKLKVYRQDARYIRDKGPLRANHWPDRLPAYLFLSGQDGNRRLCP